MKHFKNIQHLSEFYNINIKHPLIYIQKYEDTDSSKLIKNEPIIFDFYKISFVRNFNGHIQIDNTKFDGKNGILHFVEPKQIYTCNSTNPWEGYEILIHPDIYKKHFSYKEINTYDFFSYEVNESLLLNKEEENIVNHLMEMAWLEFHHKKDSFSISIILSYISTLLNLTERFYARQFKTRKKLSNQLSNKFIELLKTYYKEKAGVKVILQPTVQYFANKLAITPNYLSDTIKHQTGKSALTIIHNFIIKEAKNKLKNSNLTVAEISYQLGFEYPNYFSRLFKQKTKFSPTEYRKSVKSI